MITISVDPAWLPATPGCYIFIGRMDSPAAATIGALGPQRFLPGDYAYVGSARGPGGLAARIGHHLRTTDRSRWHLDYLRPFLQPAAVWFSTDNAAHEHRWADALGTIRGATLCSPGFGSTDCRCVTHLFHFLRMPRRRTFRKHLGPTDAGRITVRRWQPIPNGVDPALRSR
jgi:Uri superfamily endonuclease